MRTRSFDPIADDDLSDARARSVDVARRRVENIRRVATSGRLTRTLGRKIVRRSPLVHRFRHVFDDHQWTNKKKNVFVQSSVMGNVRRTTVRDSSNVPHRARPRRARARAFAKSSSSTRAMDDVDVVAVVVTIEARVRARSTASLSDIARDVRAFVERIGCVPTTRDAALARESDDEWHSTLGRKVRANVEDARVREVTWNANARERPKVVLFWQCEVRVRTYALNEDAPGEERDGGDAAATYREWTLPAREFEGAWESLVFDDNECDVKGKLLRYASNALLFSERGVDARLISWNRVVLLHGPPGTGKTTLCKALAQRLSIRFNDVYTSSLLIEVNAHSLFSRWFSESGKLVSKLFEKIQELLEDESTLVFVLVDEVESLAAARKSAANGSEPSDAIRVVNALLTQIDALKSHRNAIVLTTSNITEAIDLAFVDRADIKCYIGPPGVRARYDILRSCVIELIHRDLVQVCSNEKSPGEFDDSCEDCEVSAALRRVAMACDGLSGRALRKMPFLAYSTIGSDGSCSVLAFIDALLSQLNSEFHDRSRLNSA